MLSAAIKRCKSCSLYEALEDGKVIERKYTLSSMIKLRYCTHYLRHVDGTVEDNRNLIGVYMLKLMNSSKCSTYVPTPELKSCDMFPVNVLVKYVSGGGIGGCTYLTISVNSW